MYINKDPFVISFQQAAIVPTAYVSFHYTIQEKDMDKTLSIDHHIEQS